MTDKRTEYFCSLTDSVFIPQLLCLFSSLRDVTSSFHLFVACIDEDAARLLRKLAHPEITVIPLADLEDERLLAVKAGRTRTEYCWTLTPFIFDRVFAIQPDAERVTYLDADLMFFSDPAVMLAELEESGKDVLITEHAYDPEYDQTAKSGRFCVQFVTFRKNEGSSRVRKWWQDRCIEWCFARSEDGKFGDQKYLDQWPELFGDAVHILRRKELALAPWNVRWFERTRGRLEPVFYHFHGLRLISSHLLRLWLGYRIGPEGRHLYAAYVKRYRLERDALSNSGFEYRPSAVMHGAADLLRAVKNLVLRKTAFARV